MIGAQSKRLMLMSVVVGLVFGAYLAGRAQGADDNVTRLNSAYDFLVKARALLDATNVRAGASHVESAKKSIDKAMEQTAKAVKANGG